jgi:hypothetical protein
MTSEKTSVSTTPSGDLATLIAQAQATIDGGSTTTRTLKTAVISANTVATHSIVAAVTGKVIKVYAIHLVCSAANTVNFENGTTDTTGVMSFAANGGMTSAVNPPAYLLKTAAGAAFQMTLGSAQQVSGWVAYWDSDAS